MRQSESLALESLKAIASEKMADRELLMKVKERADALLRGIACAAVDMQRAVETLRQIEHEVQEVIVIADHGLLQLVGTVPDVTRDDVEHRRAPRLSPSADWEMDRFAREALRGAVTDSGKIDSSDFGFIEGSRYRGCEVEPGITLSHLMERALETSAPHIVVSPAVIQRMLEEVNPITTRAVITGAEPRPARVVLNDTRATRK
jgi:hypothetical protein